MNGRDPAADSSLEVTIDSIGALGDGLALFDGERITIPYAAPGDRVRLHAFDKKTRGRTAEIAEIIIPGPERVPAPCPHFGSCGGCALQHWQDAAYAAWKRGLVADALSRQGIVADVPPLIRTAPGNRRRASFTAQRDRWGATLGFNARGSHRIIDLSTCLIVKPEIAALIPPLRGLVEALRPSKEVGLSLTSCESGIDLLLTMPAKASLADRELLARFAETHDLARIAWLTSGGETPEAMITRRTPHISLGGVMVDLPPGAFLQPTAEGEAAIVAEVIAAMTPSISGRSSVFADLYAGCGTLTFPLLQAFAGKRLSAHAVEGDTQMAKTVDAAARRAGIGPRLTIEKRDLARRPLLAAELGRFDSVIFDPPRAGARAQAVEIAQSTLGSAIAVSCDASSFARDARILIDGGFAMKRLIAVDQFPWSPHVEVVASFRRARPTRLRA